MRALFAIGLISAASRLAAGQDAAKPRFEVASIRPFTPHPGSAGIASLNPENFNISTSLRFLIQQAYGLEDYQLVGPGSLGTVWTVAAKGPPGTEEQAKLMLQSLLEERFHLIFHHEMKEFKAYNLVITKGGLKLKESIPTDGCSMGAISVDGKACRSRSEQFGVAEAANSERPGMMMTSPEGLSTARNLTMSGFARAIRREAGEIVIDKTGLTGVYDIRLQYSTTDLRTGRPFNNDSPLPTMFDALQQQLGLKLESTKAMVETMVIDHVDPTPTEN